MSVEELVEHADEETDGVAAARHAAVVDQQQAVVLLTKSRRSLGAAVGVTPRHGGGALVASLTGREAVLQIVEPLDQLGVTRGIKYDGGNTTSLRDVQGVVRRAQRIELSAEP